MLSPPMRGIAGRRSPGALLVASLALGVACGDSASASSKAADAGGGMDAAGMTDLGNMAGSGGRPMPLGQLIDDGGAILLPDGAVVYLAFAARPCPEGSTLSYENFGTPFFDTYCRRCHSSAGGGMPGQGAPAGIAFDDLDSIRTRMELIWSVAGDSHTLMPASGAAPTRDERHQLGDWLACGAP